MEGFPTTKFGIVTYFDPLDRLTVNNWKFRKSKMAAAAILKKRARDLDLGSSHTAYRRASLIDLYLHIKFH